ncbi:MAG: L,D-transpeptidase family protein [Sedimenticola sp.]|nr:L,D-transpeptidase family protein [Sedimenticola sp.]
MLTMINRLRSTSQPKRARLRSVTGALLSFALPLALPGLAAAVQELPNHIFSRNGASSTTVLVDKRTRSAYLVDLEKDTPKLRRSFDDLLFGENDGEKIHEGDKRTPEGVYRITNYIPKDKLAPIYGAGAFPINYPNTLDRIEGRNGSGIWLHGRDDNDPKKQVTRGCVAFNNNQIGELKALLHKDTPVIITRETQFIPATEYHQQREELFTLFDSFIEAWENGEIDQLSELIHPEFHSPGGIDREAWLARKSQLNRLYPKKVIETDDVYAFKEDGKQVVFDFTQSYCADNLSARGKKKLFFKRDNGKLKLITESYESLPGKSYTNEKVDHFIADWLSAWRNADIDRYLSHYGSKFRDGSGKNLAQWRDYKRTIFTDRPDQQIQIDDLSIKELHNNRYQIRFKQDYRSADYADQGIKTLILEGCPGDFQIVAERWRKLR